VSREGLKNSDLAELLALKASEKATIGSARCAAHRDR
jgi:hypothetical protein